MRGISYTNVLIAALLIFCFTNMTAAQDATISVITPPYILFETVAPGIPDQIKVQLSTPFHEAVTVDLAVTPTNSPANGTLTLSAYTVTIPAGQLERSVTIANNKDGTALSRNLGFTITPTVSGTSAAAAHFTSMQSSSVLINNSDPYFISTSMDTEAVAGLPKDFYWSISDVVLDQPLLTVTWDWGDGSSDTYTGANGNITHIYATAGIYNVYIIAEDKDNGVVSRQITVNVSPSQTLQVIPVGPNPAGYYGAGTIKRLSNSEGSGTGGGLGYGIVLACLPLPISQGNYGNAYYFHYGDGVAHALIEAEPYKTAMNGYYYVTKFDNNGVADPTALGPLVHDSFFFTWFEDSRQGCDSGGLSEADRNPASTTPTAIVMLPSTTADENGDGSENVIRSVRAIFSLEWITSDNVGDINGDGIPDDVAIYILNKSNGGEEDGTPLWLRRIDNYNDDKDNEGNRIGDYHPKNPHGVGGTFDFRPVGEPFTAFQEIRGMHEGLNRQQGMHLISDPFGPEDEPDTDPTLVDTDADGFPDGWEYWFWRTAKFGFDDIPGSGDELTGEAYNPADAANGIFIPSRYIEEAFHPAFTVEGAIRRDFDNDGLLDLEELVLGTNPIHWDTDGDGICDSQEVMLGLDPCNPDTDGDGMSDGWEVANVLNPLLDDAQEDLDGDGFSNLTEYLADTDPGDPQSLLRIDGVEHLGHSVIIHWRGGVLAQREVLRTTNLSENTWQVIERHDPPTPTTGFTVDEEPSAQGFYMLRVKP